MDKWIYHTSGSVTTSLRHAGQVDSPYDSLAYYIALTRAGIRAELHIYAHGHHAFGLRHSSQAITDWPQLVKRWLQSIGVIS